MNKTQILACCFLGTVLLDISSIFWDEYYKKRDDEPVKNQVFNIQSSYTGTASGATGMTGTMSPSPSSEA